jgi:hypothetical protein
MLVVGSTRSLVYLDRPYSLSEQGTMNGRRKEADEPVQRQPARETEPPMPLSDDDTRKLPALSPDELKRLMDLLDE